MIIDLEVKEIIKEHELDHKNSRVLSYGLSTISINHKDSHIILKVNSSNEVGRVLTGYLNQ